MEQGPRDEEQEMTASFLMGFFQVLNYCLLTMQTTYENLLVIFYGQNRLSTASFYFVKITGLGDFALSFFLLN